MDAGGDQPSALRPHVAYLFTTSRDADENLAREDIDGERVFFVGNTMIDTLLRFRDAARARETPKRFGLKTRSMAC